MPNQQEYHQPQQRPHTPPRHVIHKHRQYQRRQQAQNRIAHCQSQGRVQLATIGIDQRIYALEVSHGWPRYRLGVSELAPYKQIKPCTNTGLTPLLDKFRTVCSLQRSPFFLAAAIGAKRHCRRAGVFRYHLRLDLLPKLEYRPRSKAFCNRQSTSVQRVRLLLSI